MFTPAGEDISLEGAQEKETMSREPSPSASTRTQVDDGDSAPPPHQHHSKAAPSEKVPASRKSSDGYATDESDHGEPDLEHEEAEEAVPGRELDRQLSRVCSTHRVSPWHLVDDGADQMLYMQGARHR